MDANTEIEMRLIPKTELPSIIPLLIELNPGMDVDLIRSRLGEMAEQSYRCVGAYRDGELVAISGLWIYTKIYCGRFIEPDNVVVRKDCQSLGLGAKLVDWICRYGQREGCDVSELNAYVQNSAGAKFWLNQGYKILGFHYQKILKPRL